MWSFASMADGANIPGSAGANKPPTEDRVPFSLEAEQAILGAILFDNEVHYRVSSYLKSEHFYDPVHQLIHDACGGLINAGRVASPTIVDASLASSKGFLEAGGRRYLESLAANVPSTASAPDYARVVFDLAVRRGLIAIGGDLVERARDATLDDDPARQVEDAEQALYRLAESGKYGGGFKTFRAAIAEAIELADAAVRRDGGLAGVTTGFRQLDHMLGGLHNSDLVIVAARPSMGKTALVTNMALSAARAYRPERMPDGAMRAAEGAVVGLFSLEMAAEQLATRIISEFSGVPSNEIRRGEVDQEAFDRVYHAARELENLPLYIDDTGGLSIAQLAARARRLKRQHGLGLLVVDYLQLLSGTTKKSSDNRVQEITEISMGLKTLAKELNVPIIAAAQLSRQVEQREDKRPQLSDLRESGSIEQDADVVMFIYREDYYLSRVEPRDDPAEVQEWERKRAEVKGIAEIIIGKQRHGPIGKVELQFNEKLTKFSNLERGNYDQRR
jgi:replicative DNA helicase